MSAANALLGKIVSLKIDISSKNKVRISLDSHITIVSDVSGSGKTYIHDILKIYKKSRIPVSCNLPIRVVDTLEQLNSITEESLIVMDESCDCLSENTKEVQSIINSLNSVFLIFTRDEQFKEVPYSVDDIKVIHRYKGTINLVSKYQKFCQVPYEKLTKFFIEDSTSGFTFFKLIFQDLKSTFGKDKYTDIFPCKEPTLFIFDRCGFGNSCENFYNLFKDDNNMYVLDYESFEYMLLDYMHLVEHPDYRVFNKEGFYESLICKYLPQYGKTLNCDCFISCNHCAKCMYKDEFLNAVKILKSTEYKYLLEVI